MKTLILAILGAILAAVLFAVAALGIRLYSAMYPKAKVTGRGNLCISCVGDSITFGSGVLKNRELAWPSMLPGLMGDRVQTINFGLINRTLLSTGDMPYLKEKLAKQFWNTNEDIVLLMLGTNDSKQDLWDADRYETEYRKLIENILNKKNSPQVYVMLPPQIFEENPGTKFPNCDNLRNGVIPAIRRIQHDTGVKLIDLYSLTETHADWFDDKLHPNQVGNQAIAEHIAQILSEDLRV